MIIRVNDLGVNIGDKEIIKNVTFNIEENELVMVLGLNGAGKTTLMKTLVGLIQPNKGSIFIDEKNIKEIKAQNRAKLMAYIPQNADSSLKYTVSEFVTMGITPHLGVFDLPSKSHKEEALKALEMLKIDYLKDSYIDEISGGERQLSYLARAIVQKAITMVLDEPTAYLDYKRQHMFLVALKDFVRESSKGVVLTVHDPNLALKYADKTIVIHNNTVLNVIHKKDKNYEIQFINTLNKIYDNKLRLINSGNSYMVVWEEEENSCLQ